MYEVSDQGAGDEDGRFIYGVRVGVHHREIDNSRAADCFLSSAEDRYST